MSANYVPYWEKLKDPRWQKRRLEIMQRDGFACRSCGDADSTLNVHHGYYEKGLDPWDYHDQTLFTLCEDCHEESHQYMTIFLRELGRLFPSIYSDVLYDLHSYAKKKADVAHALSRIFEHKAPIYYREVQRLAADMEERAREAANG